MVDTLLRVFDNLSVAEQAREALLAAGIESRAIRLASREDDGGPLQANFIVDSADKPNPGWRSKQSAQQMQLTSCLLSVRLEDKRQGMLVATILDRYASLDRGNRMGPP
jgi:hypothetical protein